MTHPTAQIVLRRFVSCSAICKSNAERVIVTLGTVTARLFIGGSIGQYRPVYRRVYRLGRGSRGWIYLCVEAYLNRSELRATVHRTFVYRLICQNHQVNDIFKRHSSVKVRPTCERDEIAQHAWKLFVACWAFVFFVNIIRDNQAWSVLVWVKISELFERKTSTLPQRQLLRPVGRYMKD